MTPAERFYERVFASRREKLFSGLADEGVSARTLAAMRSVPRVSYVDWYRRSWAYEDEVVPMGMKGEISTVSQPLIVGRMTDMLDPQENDSVLEVGTASGYQAAILSKLARKVVTVEMDQDLVKSTQKRLNRLEIRNVELVVADGSIAFTDREVFDKMLITAAVFPSRELPFFGMLREGGVCVAPVGGWNGREGSCRFVKFRKKEKEMVVESVSPEEEKYVFVLLQGRVGFENATRIIFAGEHERLVGGKQDGGNNAA